jgi:hypothetical protein
MVEATSTATTALIVGAEILLGLVVFVIALRGGYAVIRRHYVVPRVARRLDVPEANVEAAMDELGMHGPRLFGSRARRDRADASAGDASAGETEP